jgi:hypothetical protein
MSIASLLCDPTTSSDLYPRPYSGNILKSLDNAHSSVPMTSKTESHPTKIKSNSSIQHNHDDMFIMNPLVVSSSRYKQTSTIHAGNEGNSKPQKRARRDEYKEEEVCFVWYMRDCRARNWRDVCDSFNRQFPERQRHGLQGIQCMYYRSKKGKISPSLRKLLRFHEGGKLDQHLANRRNRDATMSGMNVRYSWMLEAPRKGCPPSENSDDGGV